VLPFHIGGPIMVIRPDHFLLYCVGVPEWQSRVYTLPIWRKIGGPQAGRP
jgi:hypothetical protein